MEKIRSRVMWVAWVVMLLLGCGTNPVEEALSPGSSTAGLSGSVYGLVAIDENRTTQVGSVQANAGWVTMYGSTVAVEPGDVMRIRGQVEYSNGNTVPVRGHIRVLVDGSQWGVGTGEYYSQNVTPSAHHMPFFVDALYVAPDWRTVTVAVQGTASRSDSSPWLTVEQSSYGHLVIERYRRFSSEAEAQSAGARLLAAVGKHRSTAVTSFGVNAPYAPVTLYSTSVSALAGDLVRIFGQATSQWNGRSVGGSTFDMHGHALYKGGSAFSVHATENTPWDVNQTPLWSDAVDYITTNGTHTYEVRAHGANGVGQNVLDQGHVYALRFSPFPTTVDSGGYVLVDARVTKPATTGVSVQANTGYQSLAQAQVSTTGRAWLRSTAAVQLAHPSGFPWGVWCALRLDVGGGGGSLESGLAAKYTTVQTEVTPLRTELVTLLPAAGTYTVSVSVACSRWDASPTVSVYDNDTLIATELFTER